jgi:hypothetical protein
MEGAILVPDFDQMVRKRQLVWHPLEVCSLYYLHAHPCR